MPALVRGAGVIATPSVSYRQISPLVVLFAAALVGVLVEAFVPSRLRRRVQIGVALLGLAGAFGAVAALHATHAVPVEGALAVDGPGLFLSGTILLFGFVSVLLLAERNLDSTGGALVVDAAVLPGTQGAGAMLGSRGQQTEAYPLLVFSVLGMVIFVQANTLLVMFIGLEVLSLPLYLLAGLARRRRLLSQEAAVKYFLLGAFSSAFFLYGLALLYGYAGTVNLGGIATAFAGNVGRTDSLFFLGLGLLSVGLLFKVGAAPFHSWTPDVYQGSPTPVTAFMATGTKVAAFGALLRVFYVAFGTARWDWRPLMWAVAILTMVVGSVLAITQTDVKRMLAYSSVAHVGFILTGLVAANRAGLSAAMFYLLAYGFTTLGAFAVVTLVRSPEGEANHLSQWRGLGRRSPVLAGSFAFFLFALAGIPLTSGFTGKFAVFQAAVRGGATGLVVVGVITSAVAAFFYARVVVLMFFTEPAADGPTVAVPSFYTSAVVGLALAVTLLLGVFPQAVLNLAHGAWPFVYG
jgi:NADH-quinone oxidoreductase subunit N